MAITLLSLKKYFVGYLKLKHVSTYRLSTVIPFQQLQIMPSRLLVERTIGKVSWRVKHKI